MDIVYHIYIYSNELNQKIELKVGFALGHIPVWGDVKLHQTLGGMCFFVWCLPHYANQWHFQKVTSILVVVKPTWSNKNKDFRYASWFSTHTYKKKKNTHSTLFIVPPLYKWAIFRRLSHGTPYISPGLGGRKLHRQHRQRRQRRPALRIAQQRCHTAEAEGLQERTPLQQHTEPHPACRFHGVSKKTGRRASHFPSIWWVKKWEIAGWDWRISMKYVVFMGNSQAD